MEGGLTHPPVPARGFASTRWTVVRTCAKQGAGGHEARSSLCNLYWYPVYLHVLRLGHPEFDAEDLTQDFFADILKRPWFVKADQTRGRFRTFLLVSLDHFLRDRFARGQTLKRGRGYQHVPLELCGDGIETLDWRQLEQSYDAAWATAVVQSALKILENECSSSRSKIAFSQIKGFLTVEGSRIPHEKAAQALGIDSARLKGEIHRLRRRYGAILREEVGRTVGTAEDVTEEVRHLRAALTAGICAV